MELLIERALWQPHWAPVLQAWQRQGGRWLLLARGRRGRFFYGRNHGPGCTVRSANNKRNNYDRIEISRKAHQHCGIFGYPGFGRDVAVTNGEDGHVAEVKQVVGRLVARAQPIERTRLMELDGQKQKIAAIANEQQAAHRSVDDLGRKHLRVGYLPEYLKHDAAKKAQIEQQHFFLEAFDKKQIHGPAHNEQRAEKQDKPQNARFEFKKYKSSKQLDGQIDGLRVAPVNIVGKQNVQNKHAPQREHEQFKAVFVKAGAECANF